MWTSEAIQEALIIGSMCTLAISIVSVNVWVLIQIIRVTRDFNPTGRETTGERP